MKTTYYLSLLAAFFILFAQCKSDKAKIKEDISNQTVVSDSVSNILFLFPSPDEILSEIFLDEIELNSDYINPTGNLGDYNDIRYQGLNLGIYIADFAYLSFTNNKQLEEEYLKAIINLSEKLNLFGLVDEKLIIRIQKNITNKDTLQQITQEMYYNLSDLLENTDRSDVFTLITTGSIVESLYLTSMSVSSYEEFENVIRRMFEQKFVFENFYEYAKQNSNDLYVKSIIDQLNKLKQTFEQLQSNQTETQVDNKDGSPKIEGGTNFIINEKAFLDFKNSITLIRQDLVNVATK